MFPTGGAARDRVTFEARALDGAGDRTGAWDATTRFSLSADILYLRGGEKVLEQRQQGVQPVVITVRREPRTLALTNAWRAVDANDATRTFNIKSVAPARTFGFVDILAEHRPGQSAT